MTVKGIDHVNLRVENVTETIGFYAKAFGLTATGVIDPEPSETGGWLRDESGRPIIHVGSLRAPYPGDDGTEVQARSGSGAIHHLALNCSGRSAFAERFAALGLEWTESVVPQVSLVQMFVTDPNGILVELNFFNE